MNFLFTHLAARLLRCVVAAAADAACCGFHADVGTVLVGEPVGPGWGSRWRCRRLIPSKKQNSASSEKTFSLSENSRI